MQHICTKSLTVHGGVLMLLPMLLYAWAAPPVQSPSAPSQQTLPKDSDQDAGSAPHITTPVTKPAAISPVVATGPDPTPLSVRAIAPQKDDSDRYLVWATWVLVLANAALCVIAFFVGRRQSKDMGKSLAVLTCRLSSDLNTFGDGCVLTGPGNSDHFKCDSATPMSPP
jgi:hypothetical protein